MATDKTAAAAVVAAPPEGPPEPGGSDPAGERGYSIASIPEKGLGVVASRHFKLGDRIMLEKALVTFRLWGDLPADTKVAALPPSDRAKYFGLHDRQASAAGEPKSAEGIRQTNALPLGSTQGDAYGTSGEATEMGVFYECSRINHSCRPNAQNQWCSRLGSMTIHAIDDIKPGEEITISYTPDVMTSAERRQRLLTRFGFLCTCSLCSSSPQAIEASDRRLRRIKALDDSLLRVTDVRRAKADARTLLSLYQEEGLKSPTLFSRTYYDLYSLSMKQDHDLVVKSWELMVLGCGEEGDYAVEMWQNIPERERLARPQLRDSHCFICGVTSSSGCGSCGRVKYCCREHQVQHWREGHKSACTRTGTAKKCR